MDLNPEKLNTFIRFFQEFNSQILQNEDDVETKFVIPMFEHLGYGSSYRRGKFPIITYNPKRSGRKPEADSIYFSTDDKEKQNEDTSLLLIEAKEPKKENLGDDVKQAKFYVSYLKPIFYIVTNGIHIIVYKSHHHRSDECLFNCPVDAFKNADNATKLYKQLNFSTVKQIKQSAIDGLTNSLYVEIMQILRQKPDFLAQIERGDFTSYTFEDEQQGKVTISKPKVALECELPFIFSGGNCKIEFSNIMLRGLTCQLTHDDIVHDFLIGLNTQPHWNTRRFIHQSSDGTFVAQLGETKVILSEQETEDLCACVDFVGEKYKKALISSETLLKSWDYQPIQTFEIPGYPFLIRGFSLVSMRPWLWQLIMQFARTFDYLDSKTDWHIFDARRHSIRIITNQQSLTNAVLWPITEDNGGRINNDWLNILYYEPDEQYMSYKRGHKHSWKECIGLQGIWTVKYTQEWISNCLIPKVLSHYKVHFSEDKYPFQILQEWIVKKVAPQIFQAHNKQIEQERKRQLDKILKIQYM